MEDFMKRLFFLLSSFVLAFMFVACDSGNTGDFKIKLKLPIDYEAICSEYDDPGNDYTYCINSDDQIQLSIYSKSEAKDDYLYTDSTLIDVNSVGNNNGGKTEFIRSLKKGTYYRFFVEVTNSNEKLKLTGGIEGVYYDDTKNYDVDIFLAPAGDFARVVADRSNGSAEYKSLESYFEDPGSKGAVAVALKDGRIFMAGGFDFEEEEISKKATIFNMKSLSKDSVKNLPFPLFDHVAALLDDKSETGKVVVGFGTMDDGLNDTLWAYDPASNKYEPITSATGITKAKAITIDGDVYIVGGCTDSGTSNAVYKISADENGHVSADNFATLKTGRCNHALADFSTVDENGNKTVRILVVGGSSDYKSEGKETPVNGENFAEIVTQGASKPVEIVDRNGGDDAGLKTSGLISPAAVGVLMDDKEESEMIAAVLGGYIRNLDDSGDASYIANPNLFVFSEEGGKIVYDSNSTPNECARPAAALLGTEEKNAIKYVAVNCGTKELGRTKSDNDFQIIFTIQVKRVKNSDLGKEVFSSSVKDTLMEGNRDKDSSYKMVDGPVAVDALGQVFMLGGKYLYQVGSYAIP